MPEPRYLPCQIEDLQPPTTPITENMGRSELVKALMEMTADLAKERAISAHFLKERDSAVITAHLESARLKAESTIDRGIIARLFKERDEILIARESPSRHVVLSSYIGEYTSEFLDAKSDFQRTSLLSSVRQMTKDMWDSSARLSCEVKVNGIRRMMAYYGFVFRDPGEGKTGGDGYSTRVPDVGAVEQLDRVLRTHREEMGATEWYLNELTAVLLRVAKHLESDL